MLLHTSAAGGQGRMEAAASQLPNSLNNLLASSELQPSLYIAVGAAAKVHIAAALSNVCF